MHQVPHALSENRQSRLIHAIARSKMCTSPTHKYKEKYSHMAKIEAKIVYKHAPVLVG